MNKCDIIIPIYNAYECVIKCLDSVIKNTDTKNNRIICIDDCSTDKKIWPMLQEYARKYDFIEVMQNEENLGFVGTVNKGMKYSKNDVLLLNSDTEVPSNWLDSIIKCAYSEKKIATVTPLSNNATLVSTPIGLQENDLPSNISYEEYAKLVDKIAYNEKMQLPTAHGFCMFIKREVLNLVGYFDEETFGKGYGEENDFSFRCLDYGYKNVLCDSVIIYHKEKQSFSEAREKLIKDNLKKLKGRYPTYARRIELWCSNFPIKHICKNINYNINLYNRKNILIIIHDWKDIKNNVGGTSLHVRDLILNLRNLFNFHVLAPENGVYKLNSYFEDTEDEIILKSIDYMNLIPRYNGEYKEMVSNLIDALGINYIHVHHMVNHFFDIGDVIKEKKIPASITIHDFYPICPTINMLYKMEKYCGNMKEKDCKACLKYKTNLINDVIPEWQKDWKELLSNFDNIIVPSEDTKSHLQEVFKDLKITVIEHGIDFKKQKSNKSITNKKKYNVAFVGVMSVHKGGLILEYLVKRKDSKICFHLFGDSEFDYLKRNKKNYVYHGRYKREDLPRLLKDNNIDLICSFSIWPETYSYTLTEEIACGIPVFAYDIGAVGDRINMYGYGWTIPLNSSNDDIYKELKNILSNPIDYKNKIDKINKYKLKTTKEMAEEYIKYYDTKANNYDIEMLKSIIKNSFNNNTSVLGDEYAWILNSLKWRIVSKIRVPGVVKKVAKKIVR